MSGNLSVIFVHSVICKAIKNMLSNQATALGMCSVFITSRFGRLVADWSIKNMTSDDDLVSDFIRYLCLANKRSNTQLILIRLIGMSEFFSG